MVVNLNMFVNIRRLRKSKAEQWSGFGLTKWSSSDGRKEVLSSFNNEMFSVLEKAMAPHSSALAWKILWTE